MGWYVDFQFANYEDCSDFGLFNNYLNMELDKGSLLAINSIRVVEQMKTLVWYPRYQNVLRMVKLWARKRGIYSNIYGYLGGISWSILVAQTWISFPNYEINRLFKMFFYLFDVWKWPQPVILTSLDLPDSNDIKLVDHSQPSSHSLEENNKFSWNKKSIPLILKDSSWDSVKVWNPNLNDEDYGHLMPIITPSFPQFNTSVNVTKSTLRIIRKEFKRAYSILKAKDSDLSL